MIPPQHFPKTEPYSFLYSMLERDKVDMVRERGTVCGMGLRRGLNWAMGSGESPYNSLRTLESPEKGEGLPAEPGTHLSIFLPRAKPTIDIIPRCA